MMEKEKKKGEKRERERMLKIYHLFNSAPFI